MERPVNLEINTSGAWRRLMGFDASNDARSDAIKHHAASLASFANAKLRIVMAGQIPDVLQYWTAEKGWHEPNRLGDQS